MAKENISCAILFADVADSTRLYEQHGDQQAQAAISQCIRLMSGITTGNSGIVVKTIGDEVLCRFDTASDAVRAACAIQQAVNDELSEEEITIAVSVGLHFGPAIQEEGDIFGDAVNVAARMASVAQPGEIITTEETVQQLPRQLADMTRVFDTVTVRGRSQPVTMYDISYRTDDGATEIREMRTGDFGTITENLQLEYNGETIDVPSFGPRFVIGRDSQCDLVITTDPASREHVSIRYRRNKFILADTSRNGTFISSGDGKEVFLRREEFPLDGEGLISLGMPVKRNVDERIGFRCQQRNLAEVMKSALDRKDNV